MNSSFLKKTPGQKPNSRLLFAGCFLFMVLSAHNIPSALPHQFVHNARSIQEDDFHQAAAVNNLTGTPAPRGIYVYSYPLFITNGDFEKALAVKGIDGGAVVMNWADIEPQKGKFDFEEFDRRVQMIRSHGLAIELSILAGGGAPSWIFDRQVDGQSTKRLDFIFSHHEGKGKFVRLAMAPPWDPYYQVQFSNMLKHLAQHLKETGALEYVTFVKLTGVNTDTDETRLPNETPQNTGNPDVSDAIAIWQKAGYRPYLVVQAMHGVAASWQKAFPNAFKVLPLIPQNSFPSIGEDGQPVEGPRAKQIVRDLLNELAAAANSENPDHFIVQMDWLIADKPVRPLIMEIAGKLSVPVAWQTNFYLGGQGKGAACGGEFGQATPCNNAKYLELLRSGITPANGSGPNKHGTFIEVFPPDAIQFPSAIEQAHNEIVH